MKKAIFGGIVTLVVFPLPSQAQSISPEATHDVQCFIAVSSLTQSSDQRINAVGAMGSTFFAGKVFGAQPSIDFSTALQHETAKLDAKKVKMLLNECGDEMKLRGDQIKAAGQMIEKGGPQR